MFELIILAFENIGPSIFLRSIYKGILSMGWCAILTFPGPTHLLYVDMLMLWHSLCKMILTSANKHSQLDACW